MVHVGWVLLVLMLMWLIALRDAPNSFVTPTVLLTTLVLMLLGALILFVLSLAVSARRLHDRGRPAAWLLIFYAAPPAIVLVATLLFRDGVQQLALGLSTIPVLIIFLWGVVELGLLPGAMGSNRFDADPGSKAVADVFD